MKKVINLMKIIIATIKSWNIKNFFVLKNKFNEIDFFLIDNKEKLTKEYIKKINPDYLFFPHWSWKIPEEIYKNYKCIVFHMTDLPFGKGGSPLQNLIIKGIKQTKISAIDVSKELDSGNIYIKKDLDISIGSAEEIFIKASRIIFFEMIPYIIKNNPTPKKQVGKEVIFKRRKPNESNILNQKKLDLEKLYDFIRMLDAKNYPLAFIKLENLKIEFSEIHIKNNKLVGRFEVVEDE